MRLPAGGRAPAVRGGWLNSSKISRLRWRGLKHQHTISREVELEGRGLFTGQPAKMRLRPGAPHTGIWFVRTDRNLASRVTSTMSRMLEESGWYIQKASKANFDGVFADKGGRRLSALIERKGDMTTISVLILVLE